MLKLCLSLLLALLVALRANDVSGLKDGVCNGGVCTGEDNADTCDTTGTAVCQCNIGWDGTNDDCVQKACDGTDGSPITDDCDGVNTACNSNAKCICQANFETVGTACNAISCDASNEAQKCTDANNICSTNVCACKPNFIDTNLAACTRMTCSDDSTCTETNSACHTGTGCDCNTLYTALATTGVCSTQKTCSLSDIVATTCGTNTVCELLEDTPNEYKCACLANYSPSAAGCLQTECAVSTVTDDCGTNFQCVDLKCACPNNLVARGSSCQRDCSSDTTVCDTNAACVGGACFCNANYKGDGATCTQLTGCSTNDLTMCHPNSKCSASSSGNCLCADTFTTSGTLCKKDCSSNSSVCGANAACSSNVCQCNVNYEGDGETCTQKTCTGAAATSCHANSKCVSDKCQCANNFEPKGQTCMACPTGWESDGTVCKKTCTSDTDCGPTTAVCTSSKCECATNYVGNGTSCTTKTCSANSECGSANNYTCTSGSCACADGFSFSNTERDCIMSDGGIVLYSLSLMIAALLLSISTNKM